MGWAKYDEDNRMIMEDRNYMTNCFKKFGNDKIVFEKKGVHYTTEEAERLYKLYGIVR